MPTLTHLLTLFGFPIHINTEPNLSSKSNFTPIPCYSGVDVSLRIIFVVGDVKNTFLKNIPLSLNSFCVSGS